MYASSGTRRHNQQRELYYASPPPQPGGADEYVAADAAAAQAATAPAALARSRIAANSAADVADVVTARRLDFVAEGAPAAATGSPTAGHPTSHMHPTIAASVAPVTAVDADVIMAQQGVTVELPPGTALGVPVLAAAVPGAAAGMGSPGLAPMQTSVGAAVTLQPQLHPVSRGVPQPQELPEDAVVITLPPSGGDSESPVRGRGSGRTAALRPSPVAPGDGVAFVQLRRIRTGGSVTQQQPTLQQAVVAQSASSVGTAVSLQPARAFRDDSAGGMNSPTALRKAAAMGSAAGGRSSSRGGSPLTKLLPAKGVGSSALLQPTLSDATRAALSLSQLETAVESPGSSAGGGATGRAGGNGQGGGFPQRQAAPVAVWYCMAAPGPLPAAYTSSSSGSEAVLARGADNAAAPVESPRRRSGGGGYAAGQLQASSHRPGSGGGGVSRSSTALAVQQVLHKQYSAAQLLNARQRSSGGGAAAMIPTLLPSSVPVPVAPVVTAVTDGATAVMAEAATAAASTASTATGAAATTAAGTAKGGLGPEELSLLRVLLGGAAAAAQEPQDEEQYRDGSNDCVVDSITSTGAGTSGAHATGAGLEQATARTEQLLAETGSVPFELTGMASSTSVTAAAPACTDSDLAREGGSSGADSWAAQAVARSLLRPAAASPCLPDSRGDSPAFGSPVAAAYAEWQPAGSPLLRGASKLSQASGNAIAASLTMDTTHRVPVRTATDAAMSGEELLCLLLDTSKSPRARAAATAAAFKDTLAAYGMPLGRLEQTLAALTVDTGDDTPQPQPEADTADEVMLPVVVSTAASTEVNADAAGTGSSTALCDVAADAVPTCANGPITAEAISAVEAVVHGSSSTASGTLCSSSETQKPLIQQLECSSSCSNGAPAAAADDTQAAVAVAGEATTQGETVAMSMSRDDGIGGLAGEDCTARLTSSSDGGDASNEGMRLSSSSAGSNVSGRGSCRITQFAGRYSEPQ